MNTKVLPGQIDVFQSGQMATSLLGLSGSARQRRAAKRRLIGMGYEIRPVRTLTTTVKYRVREDKSYPWPTATDPRRQIELFTSDVLTVAADGTITKHTGLCTFGIRVPFADLVKF